MPHIRRRIKTGRPENEFERTLEQELLSAWQELAGIINGGLRFADNNNAQIITISDSGAANSENTVAHTLKRTPTGFIVVNIDKAGVTYDSGTAWSATNIYVKCDVANCVIKLLVF